MIKDKMIGEFKFSDVDVTKYIWSNMIKLGYIEKTEGTYYKVIKDIPNDKDLKLEIALENYKTKHPNKVKNKVTSKEDMGEWLEVMFMQDGYFPLSEFCKQVGVKNTRYLTKALKDLEYIESVQGKGTEIKVSEYNLEEVYKKYCEGVKSHTKKYKKPKRSYTTEYGAV